jgi:hypothetical protein
VQPMGIKFSMFTVEAVHRTAMAIEVNGAGGSRAT